MRDKRTQKMNYFYQGLIPTSASYYPVEYQQHQSLPHSPQSQYQPLNLSNEISSYHTSPKSNESSVGSTPSPSQSNNSSSCEKHEDDVEKNCNDAENEVRDSESLAVAATIASRKTRCQKRQRTKFDQRQIDLLEAAFERTHYPDVNVVDRLATMLSLTTERISVWFQNRRAKYKRTYKPPPSNQATQAKTTPKTYVKTEAENAEEVEEVRFKHTVIILLELANY